MSHRPYTLVVPAVLSATLMLTGCANSAPDENAPRASTSAPSENSNEPPRLDGRDSTSGTDLRDTVPGISVEEAVEAAQKSTPGDLQSVELAFRNKSLVYRVEILTADDEVESLVDGDAGTVLDTRVELRERDDVPDPAIELSDVIAAEAAMTSASAQVDRPVERWSLEYSDGRLVYQVDFQGSDREVVVDAFTGDVLEIDD